MALPTERTVTGTYVNPVTGEPYDGRRGEHYIIFEPIPARWTDQNGNQVLLGGGRVNLDENGHFEEDVVCTDAPGVLPLEGRAWRLRQFVAGSWSDPAIIVVPMSDDPLDITDALSVKVGGVDYVPVPGPSGAPGQPGAPGTPGAAGPPGSSAYEVAAAEGFVGTEAQWLASLQGQQGESGLAGDSAYEVAVQEGFSGTEQEWLASLVGPEGPQGKEGLSVDPDTGITSGGNVSRNVTNPAAVDIQPLRARIVDYFSDPAIVTNVETTTVTTVELDSVALDRTITWLLMDGNGFVYQQGSRPSPSDRRNFIVLGMVAQDNGSIFLAESIPTITRQPVNQLYDLMDAIGAFGIIGNDVSPNGANLQLNVGAGQVFSRGWNHFDGGTETSSPHIVTTLGAIPASWVRALRASDLEYADASTTVDVANYDNVGTLTPVPSGDAVVHQLWMLPTSDGAEVHVLQYGQQIFDTLDDAVSGAGTAAFVTNPALPGNAIMLGYLAVLGTATNLSSSAQAAIIKAGKFGAGPGGGASVDLSGYAMLAGAEFTGPITSLLSSSDAAAEASRSSADVSELWRRLTSGEMQWGSGVGPMDAFLKRVAVGVLALMNTDLVVGEEGASAIRLKQSGLDLDLDASGADLFVSVFELAEFAGQQWNYLRLEAGSFTAHASGKWVFGATPDSSTGHTFDGLTNQIGLYGGTPVEKQSVSGERTTGAALQSLLGALDMVGLIDDASTAGEPVVQTVNGASGPDVTLGATDVGAIPETQKGAADGVASLDGSGIVPTDQLPAPAVTSVNGYVGAVSLTATDVEAIAEGTKGVADGVATLGSDGIIPSAQLPAVSNGPLRIYSVLDYGAVGDGETDDLAAFEAALGAAYDAGGGVVWVPGGRTYGISNYMHILTRTTVMAYGATIRGIANRGLVKLYRESDNAMTGYGGHSRIRIYGGIWDVNAADGTTGTVTAVVDAFLMGHNYDVLFRDVVIRNVSGAHAIDVTGSRALSVINCRFEGFKDNTPDQSSTFREAIQLDYAVSGSGINGAFDGTPSKDILIQGCYFGPSDRLGGFGRAVGSHSSVSASSWCENIQILGNRIESTLQEGIRAYAWKGAVIADNILSGTGTAAVIVTGPDPAIVGYANICQDINIHNNVCGLAGASSPLRVVGFATARPTGVSFTENQVTGSNSTGIYVSQADRPRIASNRVANCTSSSIYVINCIAPTVTQNHCAKSGSTSIGIEACTGGHVATNVVDESSGHGILISGGSNVSVTGNRVVGAMGSGIRATSSTVRPRIINNTILRNGVTATWGLDVTASATDALILNNDLTGSSWATGTAYNLVGTRQILDWTGAVGVVAPGQNLVSGPTALATFFASNPFSIAHRGSGGEFPEHTMIAYESAVAAGATAIEVSCCLTADGVLVAFHDTTLERMTGIATGSIGSYTYAQINQFAKVKASLLLGAGWADQPIPTLDDVMDRFFGKVVIFLEGKDNPSVPVLQARLLKQYPLAQSSVVWKTYYLHASISWAKTNGFTVWAYIDANTASSAMDAIEANVDLWGAPLNATDAKISEVVARGKPVIVWSVHRHADVTRLTGLGVKGLMTAEWIYLNNAVALSTDQFPTRVKGPGTIGQQPYEPDYALKYDATGRAYISRLPNSAVLMGGHRVSTAQATGTYSINYSMTWDVIPGTTLHSGIAFGKPDDTSYGFNMANASGGYHIVFRGNGDLQLYRHAPGVTTGTQLGVAATATPVAGVKMLFTVTVTPTAVSVTRTDVGPTTVTINDTTYRGRYWHLSTGSVTASNTTPYFDDINIV